ncbi:phosphodiester glycosidase family protein [Spirillospora sp. NPDC047279]|uniref:phosphodiester glycosidase family protein n=1 Tax=Spirillospora sp. NPDC047279 TaxID=3155478 RepID=UPI0033D3B7D0
MRRRTLSAALAVALVAGLAAPAEARGGLPLGPAGLGETRTSERLAPGVTLTGIVRGARSADDFWTLHVRLPQVIGPKEAADAVARRLSDAGFAPRVEAVDGPRFADVRPGQVGYTVRVGRYTTEREATDALPALTAAGFAAGVSYTAQDGVSTTGPWRLHVLTVDPRRFQGRIVSSTGGPLTEMDKVSDLVRASGAVAGINGSYFTAGGRGGSAGVHVLDGRLISEANNGRTAAILPERGRGAEFVRLSTTLGVRAGRAVRELDGINRLPGSVNNCGGVGGDLPTRRPQHDVTCTDPDELVSFTPVYGTASPAGAGAEALLDGAGRVTELRETRGTAIPAGGRTVQGIGSGAEWLKTNARPGTRLTFSEEVLAGGRRVPLNARTAIVGAGPQLVRDGRPWVNAYADGLVHEGTDRSFYYNWVLRRNPRTMIGVDRQGRLLMVVADGRAAGYSEGLSVKESADVMAALGAVRAMNLDGGGSSTLARAGGTLVNRPSDAAGERSVGDGILLLPPAG